MSNAVDYQDEMAMPSVNSENTEVENSVVENKDVETADVKSSKKKKRRGISNEVKAFTILFHERDAAPNQLFLGHLEDVKCQWSVAAEGKSFGGLNVPYLSFVFASNHDNADERRKVRYTLFPVESSTDTCVGGKQAFRVDNIFKWCRHILDVFYLNGRTLTDQEEDDLALDFDDTNDNGEFVIVEPEDVLNAYGKVFTNVADMLNGKYNLAADKTPKPVYKDANGKPIQIWMKLLRCTRNKKGAWQNVDNGALAFDPFLRGGAIEKYIANKPARILKVDNAKESIVPQDVQKPESKKLGVPGQQFASQFGAMPMNLGNSANSLGNDDAFGAMPIENEMPFD